MRTLIIAEAGVNHNGKLEIAKELAYAAREAGADIVKYQTAKLTSLVSRYAEMAQYQKENTGENTSQKEMLSHLLLSYDEFEELYLYCEEIGIKFLSSPFDIESIRFLNNLGMEFWKIPSGEITNYPYLVEIAKTGKDIVLSTGMSSCTEILDCISVLKEHGAGRLTLMQCNTQYPTPYEDVNLNAMKTMRELTGLSVGYSDHTEGIEVPIAAAALGASVIEKHFTLDRNMKGPDHKASLEPGELKAMVSAIRHIEKALGSGEKKISPSEAENVAVARKSIIASRFIKKGDELTENNLTTKRPGDGISPMKWPQILGTRAVRDFEEDEKIEL